MRKRMRFSGGLLMAVSLVIMTLPVSEADAASASDFTIGGSSTEENTDSVIKDQETQQEGFEGEVLEQIIPLPRYGSDPDYEDYSGDGNVLGNSTVVGNRAFIFWNTDDLKVLEPGIVGQEEQSEAAAKVGGLASALGNMASAGMGGQFLKYALIDGKIVADGAFYRSEALGEYSLAQGVQEIGQFSFARSTLTGVRIPEGVTDIGYGAFYHCDGLTDVELPESVMRVEPEAFTYTAWLEEFRNSGEEFLISGGVLVAYAGSGEDLAVPGGVRVIAAKAFAGHEELRTVRIPDSVLVIGEAAFEDCTGLQRVNLGDGVEKIGDRAFSGCTSLEAVRIPVSVKELGLKALGSAEAVYRGNAPTPTFETSATRLANESYRGTDGEASRAGVTVTGVDSAIASLEGATKSYRLFIESKAADETLAQAWSRAQGGSLPEQTVIYELYFTDSSGIPIRDLGLKGLTVVLPVPENLAGQDLGLVTMDRNGQLEGVGVERVTLEGRECIRFRLTGLTVIGIYGKGVGGTVGREL
ncbi:MAG: leucine-rich repeat domain-containing protein [Roseburia sp.]|nr:leucine-rich repeat domain-containing protein [Roseburia sp.]MCM1097231.1 leucine-rich repeat domain-containing protein [Ruminococcus flavefaciens]